MGNVIKIYIVSLLVLCGSALKSVAVYYGNEGVENSTQTRLENHIENLWELHAEYGDSYPDFYYDEWDSFRSFPSIGLLRPPFNHELIIWCAKKIGKRQSLEPLFQAWEEFRRYGGSDPSDDEFFLRECAYLILFIYNNILQQIEDGSEKRSSGFDLNEMRALYLKIASLPLGKLIDILDKIAMGLVAAIATHSTPASSPGIFAWVKQNWWVPPTVIAGIVTAIVLRA
mgnify:CR=1 FL=1